MQYSVFKSLFYSKGALHPLHPTFKPLAGFAQANASPLGPPSCLFTGGIFRHVAQKHQRLIAVCASDILFVTVLADQALCVWATVPKDLWVYNKKSVRTYSVYIPNVGVPRTNIVLSDEPLMQSDSRVQPAEV